MKKAIRAFSIQIDKLPEKVHYFDYSIDRSFFAEFEDNNIIEEGQFDIHLKLTKRSTFIELEFSINGKTPLVCDRSLRSFIYDISVLRKLILKYGEEEKEVTEDVIMIFRETQEINVAQYIYEFIILELPARKIHPDLNEDDDFIYKSDENDTDGDQIDPRWEKLKNIKK